MNILYIAYSCDPYNGSEDKIGWNVPLESAKTNQVYVITKAEHKSVIERYLAEHRVENIQFFYVDIPDLYKKIFKGFFYSGRLNIWNKRAFPLTKRLCKEKNIAIIHQITPIEFRAIGDYGKIAGVKFVCGPVGGGEYLPNGLKKYAREYQHLEIIRRIINQWSCFQLIRTRKIEQCDYLMFANKETSDLLLRGKKHPKERDIFFDNGLRTEELTDLIIEEGIESEKKTCVFIVVGRLAYRKGHALLLDALEKVSPDLEYKLRVVGDGPERSKLQARCSTCDRLSRCVHFVGAVPYTEIEKEYNDANVFIMPSIRETTGTVLLEALSKGLPVIAIKRFGAAVLLDETTGWLYDGASKEEYIENLKNAIEECIRKPEEVVSRGRNARKHAEQYTWKAKQVHYQHVYEKVMLGCRSE